ncbi:MAG: outer membrane lipoprotein carrier protein LolA [Phycisphaeraceae bacterium]
MFLSRLPVLFVALLCLTAQAQTTEQAPRPKNISAELWEALQEMDRRSSEIKTLRARFVRHRHTPLLREPLVSEGMVLIKGDRVRWETEAPSPSTTLIGDDQVRIYQPEDRRLEVYEIEDRASRFGAGPLPRLTDMLDDFSIKQMSRAELFRASDEDDDGAGDGLALRLTPKREAVADNVQAIDMLIEPKSGRLLRLRMRSDESQWTAYRFVEHEVNVDLPDDAFTLDLPPDVEVVRTEREQ